MHECICIFCGEYACIFDRCCEHHACAGAYVRQILRTSAYIFAYTLATGYAYVLMYVQFVHLALGNEDGGFQQVCQSTCCLAWEFIFDRRKDRGVVYVFSIFNAGGNVCGCICVYTHTHTHTAQMGYSVVSPGVGMRTLESRKNPDLLKRSIHVDCIGVQSTFVYTYAGLRVLMIWATYLFSFHHVFSFANSRRCDDNQQTTVTLFSENKRLHLVSFKQNYYIIFF